MIRKPRFLLVTLLIQIHRFLSGFFKKFSSLIGSLVLILFNPHELEEQVKRYYRLPESIETEGGISIQSGGLSQEESYFVTTYLKGKKTCLVFGCGGGRESLALAKLGFEVTGIDSAPALVERAREHARTLSLHCHFQVRDMFDGPEVMERYDVLLLSQNMYSTIPTRQRRIFFLRKVQGFLRDTGFFYIEFLAENGMRENNWKYRLKKQLTILCHGNKNLEEGDRVWIPGHYFHLFSESELLSEIGESDFKVLETNFHKAYVILAPKKG